MASPTLKLGNLANRVEAIGANTMENQARSLALGNVFSGIADTLSGKDYQAGMSGFEQALIAGARGAATGFQGKAAIEKAKGQDELNAWVQELQAAETQNAASEARLAKEKAAEQKYASIIASAVIGAQGDPERLKQTLPMYYKMMAQESGYEVVSITPQGDNPYVYSVTLKDPEDGTTETQDVNPTALGQYVFEQDADLGKQFVAALGGFDPSKLQKAKEPSGKAADIAAAEASLGRPLTEPERMKLLGLDKGGDKLSVGEEALLKKEAAAIAENPPESFASSVDSFNAIADQLISTGMNTGFGTGVMATIASGLGDALGIKDFEKYASDAGALSSQLKQAALTKIKLTGANPSNADRIYIDEITGGLGTQQDAILNNVALQAASSYKGQKIAELKQQWVMGRMDFDTYNAELAKINSGEGPMSLSNLHKTLLGELKRRQAQAMQRNAGTVPAAPAGQSTVPQATQPTSNLKALQSKYGLE